LLQNPAVFIGFLKVLNSAYVVVKADAAQFFRDFRAVFRLWFDDYIQNGSYCFPLT